MRDWKPEVARHRYEARPPHEHGAHAAETVHERGAGPAGPVPEANRPGHHAEHETDRPSVAIDAAADSAPADSDVAGSSTEPLPVGEAPETAVGDWVGRVTELAGDVARDARDRVAGGMVAVGDALAQAGRRWREP